MNSIKIPWDKMPVTMTIDGDAKIESTIEKGRLIIVVYSDLSEHVVRNKMPFAKKTPFIPTGFKHVCGDIDEGFVIEDSLGNQFVWINIKILKLNGTLNGNSFNEQFGRRNYNNYIFGRNGYNEDMSFALIKQVESVKKYGGFYLGRYTISCNDGNPMSVCGGKVWNNISWYEAVNQSKNMSKNWSDGTTAHVVYGAEYDSVLEWILTTKNKTFDDIAKDSTFLGSYKNTEEIDKSIKLTGSNKEFMINNIDGLYGNVMEWQMEKYTKSFYTVRGGGCCSLGEYYPSAIRNKYSPSEEYDFVSFRVALYIPVIFK
ncbi:MAG: hypothetical protein N2749_02490 [Clostridia bacterium]|nr:hypothetical protein [Clostridia bacterium]